VESIGYRPAWLAFARAGARVLPVPVDDRGMDIEALSRLARRESLRAVYVTPDHPYPTTVTLGRGRRMALLDLARRERFAIIEDDYDHELHYEGRPVLPLASADRHGSVVYIGTLSKVLAPGLRLGYVVAPPPVVDCLARDRFVVDRHGDRVMERTAAELLEEGVAARHIRRMRRTYALRRDLLVQELQRGLPDRIDVRRPSGGLALWARVHLRPTAIASWPRAALEMEASPLPRDGASRSTGARSPLPGLVLPRWTNARSVKPCGVSSARSPEGRPPHERWSDRSPARNFRAIR
jgi:GntR family transcriptional regulator/MocR family aminotransferase